MEGSQELPEEKRKLWELGDEGVGCVFDLSIAFASWKPGNNFDHGR